MAENMTGMDSVSCGGRSYFSRPSGLLSTLWGFWPRNTRVSMGSRRGSMGGLVTWEALMRSLSQ